MKLYEDFANMLGYILPVNDGEFYEACQV